jgi:hypothetical protein
VLYNLTATSIALQTSAQAFAGAEYTQQRQAMLDALIEA